MKHISVYMTGQIPNTFVVEEKTPYEQILNQKGPICSPEDFGLSTFMSTTACRRGYHLTYGIVDGTLYLEKMLLNTKDPKKINGIEPKSTQNAVKIASGKGNDQSNKKAWIQKYYNMFQLVYENLHVKPNFTGMVYLGEKIARGYSIHMGNQPIWTYEGVLEVVFDKGTVVESNNVSKTIKKFRKNMGKKPFGPDQSEKKSEKIKQIKKEIREWLDNRYDKFF